MKKANIDLLKTELAKIKEIDFAFLFGSVRKDHLIGDNSDVDIAVSLNVKHDLDLFSKIIGVCQTVLEFENVDLTILNNSDPILAFDVLNGELLFANNKEKYYDFYSLTCRKYEDEMFRLNRFYHYKKNRVK